MNELVTRAMALRAEPGPVRRARAVVSTAREDAHNSVVEQDWDLSRLTTVGVPVLFAHDARSLPVGRVAEAGVVGGRLEATLEFADTRKATEVWTAIEAGTLRAVSAGFVPRRARFEQRDGREVLVLSQNELVEVSVTPTPANADAVLMQLRALAASDDAARVANVVLHARALAALDAPPALSPKQFLDGLTSAQLHELVAADPAAYERLCRMAAVGPPPEPRTGEAWQDYTGRELAAIAVTDAARFDALKDARDVLPPERPGERWVDFAPAALARIAVTDAPRYGRLLATRDAPAPAAPNARWSELTPLQQHQLAHVDRGRFDALLAAHREGR